jgi:hypothetical protein
LIIGLPFAPPPAEGGSASRSAAGVCPHTRPLCFGGGGTWAQTRGGFCWSWARGRCETHDVSAAAGCAGAAAGSRREEAVASTRVRELLLGPDERRPWPQRARGRRCVPTARQHGRWPAAAGTTATEPTIRCVSLIAGTPATDLARDQRRQRPLGCFVCFRLLACSGDTSRSGWPVPSGSAAMSASRVAIIGNIEECAATSGAGGFVFLGPHR